MINISLFILIWLIQCVCSPKNYFNNKSQFRWNSIRRCDVYRLYNIIHIRRISIKANEFDFQLRNGTHISSTTVLYSLRQINITGRRISFEVNSICDARLNKLIFTCALNVDVYAWIMFQCICSIPSEEDRQSIEQKRNHKLMVYEALFTLACIANGMTVRKEYNLFGNSQ